MAKVPRVWALSFVLLLTILIGSSCNLYIASEPAGQADWNSYGEAVTLSERTPIADILSDPEQYMGKTVAIEGHVSEVCTRMGCWIEVEDEVSNRIRLKVEDGVIVFPPEVVGRRAVVQGKVEKLTYSRDEFIARARHEAEERGVEFDPDSVTPPYQEVRLWGSGALIKRGE